MVITRTPYRVSFFGGGTDYPEWYREQGGAVLGTAIDKYCYINCRYLPPFFEHRFRVVYSKIENCLYPSEIQHPVVRGILCSRDYDRGLEIHHDGDLPARSGMGSSSAFTVGFLHALAALSGHLSSKEELAREAIHVERILLKETVGCQDQLFAAYGGLNIIEFRRDDSFLVVPLPLSRARLDELNASLLLFYTGVRRIASQVAATYVPGLLARRSQMMRLREMVDEGTALLTGNGSLDGFGDLLHEAWQLKRGLSGAVSNSQVDEIYQAARAAGARGGKLLGAGGGGFMVFYAPPEKHQRIKETLRDLLWVPFSFDTGGSQVVLYSPGQDYAELDRCRSAAQREPREHGRNELPEQNGTEKPQPTAPIRLP
jgi:D-glycero-alpha-D-manno-heptose-7-phosphate kinase